MVVPLLGPMPNHELDAPVLRQWRFRTVLGFRSLAEHFHRGGPWHIRRNINSASQLARLSRPLHSILAPREACFAVTAVASSARPVDGLWSLPQLVGVKDVEKSVLPPSLSHAFFVLTDTAAMLDPRPMMTAEGLFDSNEACASDEGHGASSC